VPIHDILNLGLGAIYTQATDMAYNSHVYPRV
jgi:hypothetical protein